MAVELPVSWRLLGTGGIGRMLIAFACLVLVSSSSRAEDRPKYDVSVLAIRATTRNNEISPELRPIAEQLRKETKYTGFKLERKQDGKVEQGKTFTATLVAGYKAKVTPTERKDSKIALTVEVTRQEDKQERRLLRTTVKINSGKYYLQGGSGWKLDPKNDDVLIMAISAR
jgi:outer membrane translocation and assembly module TamA